jgi:Zn-dependent peptidase ImmA (M78 family)
LSNSFLKDKTAADIDGRVEKILKDLGNPEPPLNLTEVRELLKLDRQYYSSSKDGVVREVIHKLTLSGKQLLLRPTLIFDAIKKFDLKALYLPDRKRILLDSAMPDIKQRWGEAHETGHSMLPWHESLMMGDDKQTLTIACHDKLEAEANFAAARLLFLRDQFSKMLADTKPSIGAMRSLSRTFGNSMTTTLWRMVEALGIPAVGVVSQHPKRPKADFDARNPCKYFIRSQSFEQRFAKVTELELFAKINGYCGYKSAGPLGSAEVIIRDDNGVEHVFEFETFHNSHESLTLGLYAATRSIIVATC